MAGLLGPFFAFGGADGAVHVSTSELEAKVHTNIRKMSEEIKNASIEAPRAVVFSIILNGCMGFGMLLAIWFFKGDVDAHLSSPMGYPFLAIFQQGVRSKGGSLALAVVATLAIVATVSWVASASRMLWSFARDRSIPGWRYISQVSYSLPLKA